MSLQQLGPNKVRRSERPRHARRPRLLVALTRAITLTLIGTSAGTRARAQQAPAAPSAPPDLFTGVVAPAPGAVVADPRAYRRVEDCLAAAARVRDSVHWAAEQYEVSPAAPAPAPAAAVAIARRCAAALPPGAAGAAAPLQPEALWLQAGQDSAAQLGLARRLAQLRSAADSIALLRQAVGVALDAVQPARVGWAEHLVGELERYGWAARHRRLGAYSRFVAYAAATYDTIRLERYARAVVALVDSLPAAERTPARQQQWAEAVDYLGWRAVARGDSVFSATALSASAGTAPAPEGAFWFRRPAAAPSPRQLRLVAFVAPCGTPDCVAAYALLRDLAARFGEALATTLVAATRGYFENDAPLEPAVEAERLRAFFFERAALPGALVVEATPFTRRPAPDRRRVNQPTTNERRYLAERGAASALFLVDPAGRVLMATGTTARERRFLEAAIQGWLGRAAFKS